jgi:hypothetical protein
VITRALVAGLLLLPLAACGDDDDTIDASTPAPIVGTPTPVPTPTGKPKGGKQSAALTSVLNDANRIAPALEGYFRGQEYPRTLDEVVAALPKSGLELSKGNSIGGYRYDASDVEFVLCVENTSGAYATYDTAPMSTGQSGETGGCPS